MVATASGSDNAAPQRVGEALERVHGALRDSPACYGHGTDNPWDEAVQLLLAALQAPPAADASLLGAPLAPAQWRAISALLERRLRERQPLAYLTGETCFAGLRFRCDRRALVPRSPLAELIESGYAPWWRGPAPRRILDLCCGGGCIGIAAAHYGDGAAVTLADIDGEALALARENIALHGLGARIACCRSDLFDDLPPGRFDLILCNPPYVDAGDLAAMPAEFQAEPRHALAAGEDGLDLALCILGDAAERIAAAALLLLELGNSWEALDRLCSDLPLTWAEFARGGHGVLVAQARELADWQPQLRRLASGRRRVGV
mgnify:CR=1 FL=1